jgi:nitrate/TMAO reductase-like tetraheme cytochrome c subunit
VTSRPALLRHPLAIAGVILTTASAVVFITLVVAMLLGMLTNPYAGLVVFMAIPALFVMGLLLIPVGTWLQRKKLARDPSAVAEWPVVDLRRADVRRTALVIAVLTAVNVVIVLLAGYGGLHAMETPGFCGQVCHTTMEPQFKAWQGAVHSGVACVDCHVGEGARGFVHAKLGGMRQLMHVVTSNVPKPVPPGADMLPGAQAQLCSKCHTPGRIVTDRVRVTREYAGDETNSETLSAMQMHVSHTASSERGSHWHADPSIRIEYVATDEKRETIPYVRVTDASGQVKEFVAADTPADVVNGARRTMDCMDCHNTVGHPISPSAEQAVDRAIAEAKVSRDLPFVRREGVRLLKEEYPSQEAAAQAIDQGLRSFYQSRSGINPQALAGAVAAFQELYGRNVFPTMNVTWGTYPDHKGHLNSPGCFRCHDESHTTKDGAAISGDCEFCHKQIERP